MKKTIVLSLVAALTLSSSSVIAQAETTNTADGTAAATQVVQSADVKTAPKLVELPEEITGVITEISEVEMKVKTDDGTVYLVPLKPFAEEEGFSELGLAKDVKVTVKSMKPVVFRKDADGSAEVVTGEAIKSFNGTENKEALEKAEAGRAIVVEKLEKAKLEAAEKGAVTFSTEGKFGIAGDVKLMEVKDGEKVFPAGEITANGKTVKVDIKAVRPVIFGEFKAQPSEISGTIESIDEKGMTVKTSDEKEYWVPLVKFAEMQEFKDLGLKEGTEVTLKSPELKLEAKGDVKLAAEKIKAAGKAFVAEGAEIAKPTDIKSIGEGKLIYIPGEITANGKTAKLAE